ncbi:MAG: sugar transferase [Lachnospiraceae bacterium]|nr:sugar transferase [Lachnospiraceae bacterium]MDD7628531.1 sugar transferase [Lachnospiraceae bacterium]MDY4120057.1 sugar transferase [Lachnospiraceae bacterium]
MNRKNKLIETYGLLLLDLTSIVISFLLSTFIRFGNFRDMGDKEIHFQVCLVFLLFSTIYSFFLDWNRGFFRRTIWKEMLAIGQYSILMLLIVEVIMYFLKWADVFSRLVMVYFIIINAVLTLVLHCFFKKFLWMNFSSDKSIIKVMIITRCDLIEETVLRLKKELGINYQIVAIGCIGERNESEGYDKIPIVEQDKIIHTATTMALDEVFISTPGISGKEVDYLLQNFEEMGVDCHYNLELPGINGNRGRIENFGDYTVITYTRFQSGYKRMLLKRVIDIIGGLVGLIITGIFYPFVAIAIKLDSPGPVLFSQTRIGRNGRRFKIYKFRSMYLDAEERKKELEKQNEMQGLMFKMENDPRITKVGKFIRKTSIDELPQFYNVLKGDMSLVGTRPPTEDEFEKYDQYYRRRISMTPGLTGLWQVSGRSEIENFDDVVKYDLKYIDNWSLLLDFKILLQTVKVVFTGKGSK